MEVRTGTVVPTPQTPGLDLLHEIDTGQLETQGCELLIVHRLEAAEIKCCRFPLPAEFNLHSAQIYTRIMCRTFNYSTD